MRIGLIAFSSPTGLGYQTYDFAKNINCSKILIADLSRLNRMPVDHDKFTPLSENIRITDGIPNREDAHWITEDIDLLFFAETPLNWDILDMARDKGVKTVLQYNYEFLEYYRRPSLPKPDLLASPSYWNIEDTKIRNFAPVQYLPVPINTSEITPRDIKQLKRIGHIGGRIAEHDRNGTGIFLEFALAYAKVDPEAIFEIYLQTPREGGSERLWHTIKPLLDEVKGELGARLEIKLDTRDHLDMYQSMDLMILPRRYGGLCLPLWEAMAHGIPVMMPKIDPNDKVLPSEWTSLAMEVGHLETHSKIPMYQVDLSTLVMDVIQMKESITESNLQAIELARSVSWEKMREKYYRLFQSLVDNEYEVQS